MRLIIIVAAELTNSGADSRQLPRMLEAVRRMAGDDPRQALADAGYRSEAVFESLQGHPADLVIALGREGKKDLSINARKRRLTAAMAEKFRSEDVMAKPIGDWRPNTTAVPTETRRHSW